MIDDRWRPEDAAEAAAYCASLAAGAANGKPLLSVVQPGDTRERWRSMLQYKRPTGKGPSAVDEVVHNVVTVLLYHPKWEGRVQFDEHKQRILITDPPWLEENKPSVDTTGTRDWTDSDASRLMSFIQAELPGCAMGKHTVHDGAQMAAEVRTIYPFREYLDGLTWDETPRIDEWLVAYMRALPSAYVHNVGRWWILSAVARTYRPGCKADLVLILEGRQGAKKSTGLAVLAGQEYFTDTPLSIGNKDAYIHIQGVVIVELAELDSLRRAEASAAKAFFSSAFDKYRPPYGRVDVKIPRKCVFAATVNPGSPYLIDPTGARRYLPIRCGDVDTDGLARDRDQLWAEAVVKFRAGMKWYPDSEEEITEAMEQQAERTESDSWEETIGTYLVGQDETSVSDVLKNALKLDVKEFDRSAQIRVAVILGRMGYERKRVTEGKVRPWKYLKK